MSGEVLKVVYDQSTGVILHTLYQADVIRLGANERTIVIPLSYAKTFSSFEECCRTMPQLASAFDPR